MINVKYPFLKKDDITENYFGTNIKDPYRWLEDDNSIDTCNWVKEQNNFTDEYLKKIPFREKIKNRLSELFNYEKYSIPFKEGDYIYYFKNDGLQNQSILYREKDGIIEEFINPNLLSNDGTTSLNDIRFSENGKLCAYKISEGGSDWNKIIIIDIDKNIIDDVLINVKFSNISWYKNNGFFYSSYDKPDGSELTSMTQNHKLFYHQIGTKQSDDKLIFGGEKLQRRYISSWVTENNKYLLISTSNSTYGNELYIQNLDNDSEIITIVNNFDNDYEFVFSDDEYLYLLTNLFANNRRLIKLEINNPKIENCQEVISEKDYPLDVSSCGGKFFAHYIEHAISKVYQYNISGDIEHEIVFPNIGTIVGLYGKVDEYETYYGISSYNIPYSIYKYNINDGSTTLHKKPIIKFSENELISKQVFYTSKDGTKIPMIITHKNNILLDGNNPLILYGYGGFNISVTPSFNPANIAFMELGGIYAVPNIRGGGEYGDIWHNSGIKMNKQNVFDDFISAAEFLINNKYTSKEKIALMGRSNGGLLVGACMTQRPDLFKVCFPMVGVLDMLRYHKFTAGAGWAYDYGTSDDSKEMFEYLLGYSPLHNIKECKYPATMIITADHDDRVVPAHSFKFGATMQECQKGDLPILIKIDTNAGHGMGKSLSLVIEEESNKLSFLFYNMGIKEI